MNAQHDRTAEALAPSIESLKDSIDKVCQERTRLLELLDWAVGRLKQSELTVGLDPNWTLACFAVADGKARGLIG